ncbi:hypothetical protein U14_02393 [Candidatus Moduliflexus flocculans]|uniref:Transposase Helix-turn-helix domain-containing protein n=1 Tax=Candidatus Moduliflexus flocculans TaxID=1499966 RepID=A0A081BL85_9BACT|nr:hypothetical protein U14_02393 [Candidatus Moduliflexus flocculans]
MKRFETLRHRSSTTCVRAVGLTLDQFLRVRDTLVALIQAEQDAHPMKKRGRKAVTLTIEDTLLLTLTYLRHSPTFEQLGIQFGICESYAQKLSQRHRDLLVKAYHLPGRNALLEGGVSAMLLDVTEQSMERPSKHQRAWYSGKKTPHHQRAARRGALFSPDSVGRGRPRADA